MADDCIFCKIASGEAPAYKIYEDEKNIAMLDVFPQTRGQALVIPKKHADSYVFKLGDNELADFILVVKKVATMLKERLGADRITLVFEGVHVSHLHAKLYPDLIVTGLGKRASDEELKKLQRQITGK